MGTRGGKTTLSRKDVMNKWVLSPQMSELPEDWYVKFLEALRQKPIVTYAARKAGVSTRTAYQYREDNEDFAKAWDDARRSGIDRLEETMLDRAFEDKTKAGYVLAIYLTKIWRYGGTDITRPIQAPKDVKIVFEG